MEKIKIQVKVKRILADTLTPVSIYLKFRDLFKETVLLESNDFKNKEDSSSFLGFDPIANFSVQNGVISKKLPGEVAQKQKVSGPGQVEKEFKTFLAAFDLSYEGGYKKFNGLFGYTAFDGVQYFDSLEFDAEKQKIDLPEIYYSAYRYVIAFDHFKDELFLLENLLPGEESRFEEMENLLFSPQFSSFKFKMEGEERSNLADEEFMELVEAGKKHCRRGDVFQIVFARQFQQQFTGDDFNVYRVLRSVNPSPYLFYFDFGTHHIFGSSPESQIIIKDGKASINPIAGTYKRTGEMIYDAKKAVELAEDPKENAEHIMLVDLARNDLGRHTTDVTVTDLKDIQFFSHVIHLVSKVEGKLEEDANPIQIFGDTFPAGTLSGAPKYRAIELIDEYENQNRSFYGGALGFIDFNGEINHAILIRSFLSLENTLYYQAGAGIVDASVPEKELQEVNNKLGALKKALVEAEKL